MASPFENVDWNAHATAVIVALIVFNSSTLALQLPSDILKFFEHPVVKIAALSVIMATMTKDPVVSIGMSLAIFAILNAAQHYGMFENYQVAPYYDDDDRIVTSGALENDIFRARQRNKVKRDKNMKADENLFHELGYGFSV